MARQAKSLRGPGDLVLRIRGYEAGKTPTWFALSEDRAALRLRRPLDALARCASPKSAPIDALMLNPHQAMLNVLSQMSFGALGGTQITRHFDREIERGASFLRQMVQGGGAELLTP
jgi:hypothetical protein